jgi:Cu/Ag efflux pump CusA
MVSATLLTLIVVPAIYAVWKGRHLKEATKDEMEENDE